jgi:hypothetical protein
MKIKIGITEANLKNSITILNFGLGKTKWHCMLNWKSLECIWLRLWIPSIIWRRYKTEAKLMKTAERIEKLEEKLLGH